MSDVYIPYEEKRFVMEFINIWKRYGKPPFKLKTANLDAKEKEPNAIIGLQHQFVNEVLELADYLKVDARIECLGVKGSFGHPVMEAEGDEEEEDDADAPTNYADEDPEADDNDTPTDYGEEAEGGDDDNPTDYGADAQEDEGDAGGEEEGEEMGDNTEGDTEEGGTEDAGGETEGLEEDAPTDYGSEAGGDDTDMSGDESGDDSGSEDSSSDEQSDSSNVNTLVKNFSLMGDFESLYALITDSINTLNSTLKADPGQNRVLVQVSRNLTAIKDFILTFVQFHFKNDNYQYNLYYYETVVQLLKLNLAMLEKALSIGESKQEKESKEVNKNG